MRADCINMRVSLLTSEDPISHGQSTCQQGRSRNGTGRVIKALQGFYSYILFTNNADNVAKWEKASEWELGLCEDAD